MPFAVGGHLWVQAVLRLSPSACSTTGCCCHIHGSCKLASRDSFYCRALPLGPLLPWQVSLYMRDVHVIWLWDPVPLVHSLGSMFPLAI
jgi:hypothetical protein